MPTRANSKNASPDADEVVAAFPPIIVTDGAIEKQKKDRPDRRYRVVQAYQFDGLASVEELTGQGTTDEIGADNLAALVQLPKPDCRGSKC